MAAIVDLDKSRLLEELKRNEDKYKKLNQSINLIAIQDSSLFVWSAESLSLFTQKLHCGEQDEVVQTLLLTNSPLFEVNCILFNYIGHLLVIYGLSGVMIIEMPRRWGKFSLFEGGKDKIFCRSWNIAELFFVSNSKVNVVHVAWHPGSKTDNHLTILSSDNYLRIYEATDPQVPYQVIALSSTPQSFYLTSNSRASFSSCLGETAVSFDFGSPSSESSEDDQNIYWPIYILKGNGDVYIFNSNLYKKSPRAKVKGPLTMYPHAVDNYGIENCSLICLQITPPILVIATSSGILYHCIVLNCSDEVQDNEVQPDNKTVSPVLYAYEKIELSLTLTTVDDDADDKDDIESCPIRLHKDLSTNMRYHCTHIAGIHGVALPLVQKLEQFIESDDPISLLHQLENQESIVEHILCTQPLLTSDPLPVIGFAIATNSVRITLISLLSSWEFICLPLFIDYQTQPPDFLNLSQKDREESENRHIKENSFEQYINNILKHSITTPILKSSIVANNSQSSTQEWLQILCNASQRLREEYIDKLNNVQVQVEKRIKVLKERKKEQVKDLEQCMCEKETIRNKGEEIAEKYEDIYNMQQSLVNRIEKLLQKLQFSLPVLSDAEVTMKSDLQSLVEKLKNLKNSAEQIRTKFDYQQKQMSEYKSLFSESNDSNITEFKSSQLKILKEILEEESSSISEMVKKINWLKKETGV